MEALEQQEKEEQQKPLDPQEKEEMKLELQEEMEELEKQEEKEKKDGILLPVLYVLLALVGVFTVAAIAGSAWYYFHPVVVTADTPGTQTPETQVREVTSGPRTMISTYSIRAAERGWSDDPGATVGGAQNGTNQNPVQNPAGGEGADAEAEPPAV